MTNDELKKKIAQIIADYFCPQGNEHKKLWGDDRLCYSKMNFAECEWVTECTDALIAVGIGDVSELKKHRVQIMKDGTIQQFYSGKEVEQIVKERDEYKHRAEVTERALQKFAEYITCYDCPFFSDCDSSEKMEDLIHSNYCFAEYLRQAEKELAEERKDEN